jgi:hypothetical protein
MKYMIDKTDFLEIYAEAREKGILVENIKKAWANVGLLPFDPQVILSQLPLQRLSTPLKQPPEPIIKV